MRRSDELMLMFPGRRPNAQKWVLGQLDGLAAAFDAPELLAFLLTQTQAPDPPVRNQALFSLGFFLPRFVRARNRAPGAAPADPQALRRGALEAARPAVDALLSAASAPEPEARTLALLALAQFPVPEVEARLLSAFHAAPSEFELLLPHVRAAEAGEMSEPLVDALKRHHAKEPDLLLLLAGAPAATVSATAAALAPATNALGRANLAIALAHVPGCRPQEAFGPLMSTGEGWTAAFVLMALEATRDPSVVPLLESLLTHPTELVQVEAVRVAGTLGGPAALELCSKAARGAPRVAAQALESLVQLKAPAEVTQPVAEMLLTSSSLSARIAAVLALEDATGKRVEKLLLELAMSEAAQDRLKAAGALATLQTNACLSYLGTLAKSDPSPPVRAHATKSLSKYPLARSLPALFGLLDDADPRVAQAAGFALARYDGEEAREVGRAAGSALSGARTAALKGRLFRLVGHAAGRAALARGEELLARGLSEKEPEALIGLLDGVKLVAAARRSGLGADVALLATHAHPAVAARAATAALLLGELSALSALTAGIARDDVTVRGAWLQQSLDLGVIFADSIPSGAFPLLADRVAPVVVEEPPPPPPPPPPVLDAKSRIVTFEEIGRPEPESPPSVIEGNARLGGFLNRLASRPDHDSLSSSTLRDNSLFPAEGSSQKLSPVQRKPPAPKRALPWKPVAAAVVVLAAVVWFAATHARVHRDPGDAGLALSPGGPVKPGQKLTSGKDKIKLVGTASSSTLTLFEQSEAVVMAPDEYGWLRVKLVSGRLDDEAKGEPVMVVFEHCSVETVKGEASVRVEGEKLRAINMKGEVQIRHATAGLIPIPLGNGMSVAR